MKVLVVDDDEGARSSLSGFIKSERHTCRTAKSGIEALKILGNYRPDLIIADISMPKMTGVELARYIRAEYSKENVKIILVSGSRPTERELQVMADIGIDDIIKKPMNVSKLRQHLLSRQPCS